MEARPHSPTAAHRKHRSTPLRLPTPCSAKTNAGHPCRFAARKDTGLCINHDPSYKDQQLRNVREGARRSLESRRPLPVPLPGLHLTSRGSIQALLDLVVRLELTGQLPEARARHLLRALSIATRNLDRGQMAHIHREHYAYARHILDDLVAHFPNSGSEDA